MNAWLAGDGSSHTLRSRDSLGFPVPNCADGISIMGRQGHGVSREAPSGQEAAITEYSGAEALSRVPD